MHSHERLLVVSDSGAETDGGDGAGGDDHAGKTSSAGRAFLHSSMTLVVLVVVHFCTPV